MIKKLLLMMVLVSSTYAFNENFSIHTESANAEVNPEISVIAGRFSKLDPNPQDWIAIYKKGDSNDWKNVLQWSWVKPIMKGDDTFVKMDLNLPSGDYEVRYFLNNSYTTYRAKEFTLQKAVNASSITVHEYNPASKVIRLDSTWSGSDNRDWVGIYRKGTSNAWNNVLTWSWVTWAKDKEGAPSPTIAVNLPSGKYEARLFYRNSYKLEAKDSFIIVDAQPAEKLFNEEYMYFVTGSGVKITISKTPNDHVDTDWVGVFNRGDAYTLDNLIAWAYIKGEGYRDQSFKYHKQELLKAGHSYIDAVYFHDNSYTNVKEIKELDLIYEPKPSWKFIVKKGEKDVYMKGPRGVLDKDWIAIFKKGDAYTSDNIINWTYGKNLEDKYVWFGAGNYDSIEAVWRNALKGLVLGTEYTAVFFLNDTYKVHAVSDFIVEDK